MRQRRPGPARLAKEQAEQVLASRSEVAGLFELECAQVRRRSTVPPVNIVLWPSSCRSTTSANRPCPPSNESARGRS